MIFQPIISCTEAQRLDQWVQTSQAVSEYELMKKAALAFVQLLNLSNDIHSILVCCGAGNNGGDGWCIAQNLNALGYRVQIVSAVSPACLTGAAAEAYEDAMREKLSWSLFTDELPTDIDVCIDALLGIGFQPPLRPLLGQFIEAINHLNTHVISVDVPSGVNADTGHALQSILARETITFFALKPGLLTGIGRMASGRVGVAALDCDDALQANMHYVGYPAGQPMMDRSLLAYKNKHGHVAVVGGLEGMSGAAILSSEAALKSGAGLVTVFSQPATNRVVNVRTPAMMTHNILNFRSDVDWSVYTSIAVGPGLGESKLGRQILTHLIATSMPLVVDASALRILAKKPVKHTHWVLTPHSGEAAYLLGKSVAAVEADRVAAARALQNRYGGVVVLKGPGTIVCNESNIWLNSSGSSALAVAGSGDTLTGIIAAFIAQGKSLLEAALLAVWTHGKAGELWQDDNGKVGLEASELGLYIRKVVNGKYNI